MISVLFCSKTSNEPPLATSLCPIAIEDGTQRSSLSLKGSNSNEALEKHSSGFIGLAKLANTLASDSGLAF